MSTVMEQKQRTSVGKGKIRSDRPPFYQREWFWGYVFIAPTCIGLLIFNVYPILYSFFLSFTSWDGSSVLKIVGLQNFVQMFHDPDFLQSMRNTFLYTVVVVPVGIALSVIVAVLLNGKVKGRIVWRTIFFLPSITMPIAIGVVWKWIFNANSGLLNYLLSFLGIHGPHWISDPKYLLVSVMIVAIWGGIGYSMIIFLAGLQSIAPVYYEAAAIDGAGPMRQFFKITLPLLSPAIFFVLVTGLISALQVFDLPYIFVGAGSMTSDSVLVQAVRPIVMSIYQNGFQFFKLGYASAEAWVLFVIILIVTLIQMWLQKRWVHYEQG
jgi:multiple sugar transport system permease protein